MLQGHEGAIHHLAWDAAGAMLCSASEDRSARLWDARDTWSECDTPRELRPVASLFGHTGRVWDAAFVDGSVIATVAEDGTARLWRHDGTQLAAIQGHRGRGIWRCAVAAGSLVTGGTDGGVKMWQLADWLPCGDSEVHASAGGTDNAVFAEPIDAALADGPRMRGKECVFKALALQVLLMTDVCTGQLLPLRRGCLAHVVVVCFKFGRPFCG